ncbi:MAG: nucleotide sugar dehydrogenase [Parvularculaceae bacterium]
MEKVVVIGLGYVGLPSAALIAEAGYTVLGVDINRSLIERLRAGECPLAETQIRNVVEGSLRSGRLTVDTAASSADIFIICVPTPITENKHADLTMVAGAIRASAPFVKRGDMVILESTSPIGTTEALIAGKLREIGLDPLEDIDVCYCPERVFPGDTVREIIHNDRVVGGLTPRASERAKRFYESFCKGKAYAVTAAEAEFSKLMENTYRDVNIALANSFAHVAEEAGVDVAKVIAVANRHPRVNVHRPGPGVGGHCIPVDPWFVIEGFPNQTKLLHAARLINDGQPAKLLDRAEDCGLIRGSKVAVLGAAYRGNIDDARDTPTELLLELLHARGYSWSLHDPFVKRLDTHSGVSANLTSNLAEAAAGAAAVFLMTDHDEYKNLSPSAFGGARPDIIVDGRRLVDVEAFVEAGATVLPVGAPARWPHGQKSGGRVGDR